MGSLIDVGVEVAARRKSLGLSQSALAERAAVSRATLDALENGRVGEMGFSKIGRILLVLGLELTVQTKSSRRPTLDELMEEDRRDQDLDGRKRRGTA